LSLKYKISFMTQNIHTFNYYKALQLLTKHSVLGLLVRSLIVKT